MGWIKRVFYGVLIGVASIAPGLSGGTIAIALGFYEDLINSVANLLKHFKKNFLFLFPFGLGAMVSIAALSVVINYFFINFPLPTNTLFIGFIIGTLPFIYRKIRQNLGEQSKMSVSHFLTMAVFFVIVLLPIFLKGKSGTSAELSAEPLALILLVGIGMIAATTLVVPGLSGTMILTSLGYYKPLLLIASTFVTAVVTLDWNTAIHQVLFIAPLGVGVIIGVFLMAKLISLLFRKIPAHVYSAIAGLIIATPIVMLADISLDVFSAGNIIISVITLFIGLLLVRKLGDD